MTTKQLLRIAGARRDGLACGKWPGGQGGASAGAVVHGATFGSALFDLSLPGYSLMRELADSGRFVYAVDISGYGASSAPGDGVPRRGSRRFRARGAIADVGAAVSAIGGDEGSVDRPDRIFLGTIVAGWYAARHVADIRRLALYAPLFAEENSLWQGRIGDPADGAGSPVILAPIG